jgi:hypothetical protein
MNHGINGSFMKKLYLPILVIYTVITVAGCDLFTFDRSFNVEVQFDPAPGTYDYDVTVDIITNAQGAIIKYTTDGSDPRNSGTAVQANSVRIGQTTDLKAYAERDKWRPTEVITVRYSLPIVFIVGEKDSVACYWRDGEYVELEPLASAGTICVNRSGNDENIYVGGRALMEACLWINGTRHILSNYSENGSIRDIEYYNNSLYMCGSDRNGYSVLWIDHGCDGIIDVSSDYNVGGAFDSISVTSSDIYISGKRTTSSIWFYRDTDKDGIIDLSSDIPMFGNSDIAVNSTDVYICGYGTSGNPGITINGSYHAIPRSIAANSTGIALNGNAIYVSGYASFDQKAFLWVDDIGDGTGFEEIILYDTSIAAETTSITVFNDVVYISGMIVDPSIPTPELAVFWKNDGYNRTVVSDSLTNARSNDIFVLAP